MLGPTRGLGKAAITLVLSAMAVACGNDNTPTTPTPPGSERYDGEWSGTTSQGRPITFTVSADQRVTAIAAGYSFNGCSGTNTFSNLNLAIGTPPNPAAPASAPGFGFGSGPPDGPNFTQISGSFGSTTAANGTITFLGFAGCGNSVGIWTAAKR
jgi:hypothetical protein